MTHSRNRFLLSWTAASASGLRGWFAEEADLKALAEIAHHHLSACDFGAPPSSSDKIDSFEKR